MPARAPLANRVGVSSCFFPFEVNHCGKFIGLATWIHCNTHLLELFIRRELDGTIRYDSDAIDPIPSHESLETLLFPYTNKTSPHSRVLLARVSRLNLSASAAVRLRKRYYRGCALDDFKSLQRRNNSPRRRTSDSTGDEIRCDLRA